MRASAIARTNVRACVEHVGVRKLVSHTHAYTHAHAHAHTTHHTTNAPTMVISFAYSISWATTSKRSMFSPAVLGVDRLVNVKRSCYSIVKGVVHINSAGRKLTLTEKNKIKRSRVGSSNEDVRVGAT